MRVCILLVIMILSIEITAQVKNRTDLFRDAYAVYELMRNDKGIYRDSKLFTGSDYHPSSVANIGIGLISICIADAMNWIDNGAELAEQTLFNISGLSPDYSPDRNANGFYRHFIDMDNGSQQWDSEYSTIDSGILTCGALFCKNYFSNNSVIAQYANEIWNSISWTDAIANSTTGEIYMVMNSNGTPNEGSTLLPFNEYMIVAWLAMNQEISSEGEAHQLWNTFYANPDNLPSNNFSGLNILTDNPGNYLSSFVALFPYYLCNYFTTNTNYTNYLKNNAIADMLWWENNTEAKNYEWGCGAGEDFDAYKANSINNNTNEIVSPHIVAGFLPLIDSAHQHIDSLLKHKSNIYEFSGNTNIDVLWRYSLTDNQWRATGIQGIDFSTMLFGLAALEENLGVDFFISNNNFFSITDISQNNDIDFVISNNEIHLNSKIIDLIIYDISGRKTFFKKDATGDITLPELSPGMYIIQLTNEYVSLCERKILVH